MGAKELAQFLKKSGIGEVAEYFKAHPALAAFLDRSTGTVAYQTVISEKADAVREVTRGYGKHGDRRPDDYLEAFRAFVTNNMNKLPALLVVTQRPRELTREDLRQLKLALDQEGFGEKSVQTAWREQKERGHRRDHRGLHPPARPWVAPGALRRARGPSGTADAEGP